MASIKVTYIDLSTYGGTYIGPVCNIISVNNVYRTYVKIIWLKFLRCSIETLAEFYFVSNGDNDLRIITGELMWIMNWMISAESDVYWSVLRCDNWRIKNQLDVTYYFIVLLIGSTCFGHYYAHHQELVTMMLITTLIVSFLVCCMLEIRCG